MYMLLLLQTKKQTTRELVIVYLQKVSIPLTSRILTSIQKERKTEKKSLSIATGRFPMAGRFYHK